MIDWLGTLSTRFKLVFWVEALGLSAFSASWFVKSETLTPMVTAMRKMTVKDQAAK